MPAPDGCAWWRDGAAVARCPSHGWSYDLQGRLLGAPQTTRRPGFYPSGLRLPSLRAEVWEGWIHLTPDPVAPALAERLAPLPERVGRSGTASYVPVATEDYLWRTNWKLLTENFMESYHLPVAHRETLGPWLPLEAIEFPAESRDAFTYENLPQDEAARYGRAHPANTRLEGRWRYTSVMPTVDPTHMYVVAPDHLWCLSLRPRSVGGVDVRFGVALAPEVLEACPDRGAFVRELVGFFDRVNEEDRAVVEGIYAGIRAPLARPGPLSWLERKLHDFIGYPARRLAGWRGADARIRDRSAAGQGGRRADLPGRVFGAFADPDGCRREAGSVLAGHAALRAP